MSFSDANVHFKWSVLVLRASHGLRTRESAGEFLGSVNEDRQTLRAHPDRSAVELERKKRAIFLGYSTVDAIS